MVDVSQYASFTFVDISPFEMFLYSASPKTIHSIFSYMPIYQVFRMYRVSLRVAVVAHHYVRTAWSLDTFLDRWFGPDTSDDVVEKMEECGAIISGSTVLHFLMRDPPCPDSDLDIYVPLTGLLEFGRWLQQMGYSYRPRGTAPLTFFDVAALTLPARWSASKHAPSEYDPLTFREPFEVFDFIDETVRRLSGSRSERLQLVVVLGDPRKHILTFHSTLAMNYITSSKAVSLFPISTFEAQRTWACRGTNGSQTMAYGASPSWREKYERRGFSVVDSHTRDILIEPKELSPQRTIGDCHTWTLDFERRPVFARRGRLKDSDTAEDDMSFEIITPCRGPVTSGSYLNIAPPFTISTFAICGTFEYLDVWPYGGTLETMSTFGV